MTQHMRDISGNGVLVMPRTEAMFYGPDAVQQLPAALAMQGIQRPFLLTTASLVSNGQAAQIEAIIGSSLTGTFGGARAHNQLESVLAAVDALRQTDADGLVVLGGSSVVDLGKAVAMVMAEGDAFDKMRVRYSPETGTQVPPLPAPKLPQIVVPTTLSGSEYTFATAITDPAEGGKLMFADAKLIPKLIIHDGAFCMPTPDRLWAATGMKILADCLEMMMSLKAMPMGNLYAGEGMRVLFDNLAPSIGPNAAQQARQNLHYGAYLAMSMAFNVSLGLVAGTRHQLGGGHGVPHGEASTIMLPHVMRWNRQTAHAESALAHAASLIGLSGKTEAARADALIEAVEALVDALALPTRLSQVGIKEADLASIAAHVVGDPSVAFNPRPVDQADALIQLLHGAL